MTDRCEVAGCRAEADLSYRGHGVCDHHWNELTNENAPPDALRKALGIAAEPDPITEENTMSSKKKAQTKTDAKPEKAAKKREPKEKTPLRTVALRLPEADFQLIHRAAGDRQLAHFMRTTLLAAAQKTLSK